MAWRVYDLIPVSGSVAINDTVAHNSPLAYDSNNRVLYQDPAGKIVKTEVVFQSGSQSGSPGFIESPQDGRDALVAKPNTHIVTHNFLSSNTQSVFYLQTNESNIAEYRCEVPNYTVCNTSVIYAG